MGEEESEPAADVPMVCTVCREPVEQGPVTGQWFHSGTSPARCSRTVPVKAMVAAGNENIGSKEER